MRPHSGDVPETRSLHGHRGQVTDQKLLGDGGPDDAIVVGDRERAVPGLVGHPGEAEHERGGGAGFGTGIDRADARDMEVMRPMLWPRIENPLRAPDQQAMGRALGCDAA